VNSILVRGGRMIDPSSGCDSCYDLLITEGRIGAVERPGLLAYRSDLTVIDATGCWVTPGLIDVHVHFRDPGFAEKETIATGLRAAAAGGFTTVAAMANTSPVNDLPEVTRYMLARAADVHAARLVPVSAVTRGLAGQELVDLESMAVAGCRLFSDDGMPIDNPELLSRALIEVSRLGFTISLHEEERSLARRWSVNRGAVSDSLGLIGIPNSAESSRIDRDLRIALLAQASVHFAHVSARESLDLIRQARRESAFVTAEATPHHLAFCESAVLRFGPDAKMNPPLRVGHDVEALREALRDGTIDIIATDHAPHDPTSKKVSELAHCFSNGCFCLNSDQDRQAFQSCANGVVGLETALGLALDLVHRGVITPTRLVELMSTFPARLLRLDQSQHTLSPRARADISIIDPELEWTVDPAKFHSKGRNTPFSGMKLRGRAQITIVAGQIVYDGRLTEPRP
jgi:dihydroorotase